MTDLTQDYQPNYIELTADIVVAYVSNNSVPIGSLGELLSNVYSAVSSLARGGSDALEGDKIEKATPAQIRKSMTQDHLISFEDGKPYKTLRRHLTLRGLTPEAYRAKHGLPPDYPMTSASYSAQRSELARALGLGQVRRGMAETKASAPEKATVSKAAPAPEEGGKATISKAAPAPEKPKKAGRPRKAAVA